MLNRSHLYPVYVLLHNMLGDSSEFGVKGLVGDEDNAVVVIPS